MIPIIAAVTSMFAKEGLNLLAGAIKAGREEVVEKIEKKTGIDIKDIANPDTETKLSTEQFQILQQYELEETLNLARLVSAADVGKAPGIIMAAVAPEVPEISLFFMGLVLVLGFAIWGESETAGNLASAWLGAFAMYVKGK